MAHSALALVLLSAASLLLLAPTANAQGGSFIERLPFQPAAGYVLPFDQRQNVPATNPIGIFFRNNITLGNVTTPQSIIVIGRGRVLAPHFHPRGTEQLYVLSGRAEVVQLLEDGTLRRANLSPGSAIILPAGGVHYTRNTGNQNLQLIQTFDNPLAGTVFISNAFLAFDRNIANGALVGANLGPNVRPSATFF